VIRIGVFGGSFNPVHFGHLHVAQLAIEAASLDQVLFVPAATPPHKDPADLAAAVHRTAMLSMALSVESKMDISVVEMDLGAPPYTIDTLRTLRMIHPQSELFFVMGWDSLRDLHAWKDPEAILSEFEVIAVDRPGFVTDELDPVWASRCRLVTGNPFALSGTGLRARAAAGLSLRHLTPDPVADYIKASKLYSTHS
jgi:nicotinate-nucleotide adenylyltransferase